MKKSPDRWDSMLEAWKGSAPQSFLDANARVGDAVFMAWLWWDAKYPEMKPTPSDLIAMARLIMEQDRWITQRELEGLT